MEIGQKVKIISDSTCDLSQELTAKYDIDILPLHILLGENEFRDGKDTTPDRIFAWGEGLGGGVALAVSALDEQGLACTAIANPLPDGLEALSSRVRGSVLMGTSLMDTVSDPKDQFAVFNGLECDRRHIIYAKYAHERINAFENEVVNFFNQTFYPCSLA